MSSYIFSPLLESPVSPHIGSAGFVRQRGGSSIYCRGPGLRALGWKETQALGFGLQEFWV